MAARSFVLVLVLVLGSVAHADNITVGVFTPSATLRINIASTSVIRLSFTFRRKA